MIGLLLACLHEGGPALPQPEWPDPAAALWVLTPPPRSPDAPKRRILLDPGHGDVGNSGNVGCYGQSEQEVTMRHALRLEASLVASGRFEVRLTRRPGELADYPGRVVAADAWPADALLSLHTDARAGTGTTVRGDRVCNVGAAGFSVLWSDEVPEDARPGLADDRRALAVDVATSLSQAGFLAYGGEDYGGIYGGDPVPGVFVDRHRPSERIRLLRRPHVPSVIVETHNAIDPDEPTRWEEDRVHEAFAAALVHALGG